MTRARRSVLLAAGTVLLVAASVASLGLAARLVAAALAGDAATWLLGRAGGVASYLLLVALVTTGLVLAHPWARHLRLPSPRTRLAVHVSLASFTAVFTALHVVVLALDPWAGVGWAGALLPMASGYRPVAVTLGVIALWAGLAAGVTAAFAGRWASRVWWPVHKVAAGSLVLVWAHSVLAGSDVAALQGLYLTTGSAVVALAVTRYAARTPADEVEDLTRDLARPADLHRLSPSNGDRA
jgi:hypothetical protein